MIIFSHGYWGNRNVSSVLCGSWAAKGFVVFAAEHRFFVVSFVKDDFVSRDTSALYTYILHKNADGVLVKEVIPARMLNVREDIENENSEFDGLARFTRSVLMSNKSIPGPYTRARVH